MAFTKQPHAEPIPGYRLIAPLGRGGFGEVWKCQAPGGLFKAIKFVYGNLHGVGGDTTQAHEELQAVERIKDIRHPFLLSIDRVEHTAGELMIVTELADRSLHEVLFEYQQRGHAGLPREELLRWLAEAAEVLDLMNGQYGLQHLDVKPRNLFLVSNHVKVADFGLVTSMGGAGGVKLGSVTPLYAAPEVFQGQVSRWSDQYSLACCYMELLTGKLPFVGSNSRQLLVQHVNGEPDLAALPAADRPIVARALAKDPQQRHASCVDLVRALQREKGDPTVAEPRPQAPISQALTQTPSVNKLSDTEAPRAVQAPPLSAELTGYHFVEGLSCTLLADVWKATAPDGRSCQVKFIYGFSGRADEAVARLKALEHPGLPRQEVLRNDPGCLVVAHDYPRGTLRGRWIKCQAQDLYGIPRSELLGWFRTVAEILDYLYQQHSILHLQLNPRALMLTDSGLQLDDFGLAHLFWVPGHQPLAQRNARYAAPELFDRVVHRSSDQFSLAVMYQELLTATHPFNALTRQPINGARARAKPELGPLPDGDRDAVGRALDPDPAKRWPSCTDFIRALETAEGGESTSAIWGRDALDEVIASPDVTALPAAAAPEEVTSIIEALYAEVGAEPSPGDSFGPPRLAPGGEFLQHRFRVGLPIGAARVKVDAFRQQCNGQLIRDADEAYEFYIDTPANFWQTWIGRQAGLKLCVQLARQHALSATPIVVTVTIQASGHSKKKAAQLVEEMGATLVEGLRTFLLVNSEKRTQDRLLWPHPVEVCGIEADGTVGSPVLCRGKDISLGGIGFYLPHELPTAQVLIRLPTLPPAQRVAIPATVVRAQRCADGWYDVGALFRLATLRSSTAQMCLAK
jgi:serine/threonine protein kinase